MDWMMLLLAGVMEVGGVTMLNEYSQRKQWWLLIPMALCMAISIGSLGYAIQTIPMGTGYAIWTGIGAVGATVVGMLFYGESRNWRRLVFIALIVISVVGLKLTTGN